MPDLYSDGRHYDAILGDQDADLGFYLALGEGARGPLLELACGTGRLSLPLAKAGHAVTGLDLGAAMLARAREKAAAAKLAVEWIQADVRDFSLGRRFPLILFPYNSIEHLHDEASLRAMFACVKRHLAPGGRFVLDLHMPSLGLLGRRPGEIYPVDGEMGQAPDGSVVTGEEVSYNEAAQAYRIRWHYSQMGGGEPRVDELNLRMFFPQELDALLRCNGFEILKKSGDFKGTPFASGALKQVVIACAT
jgi:SAM-dependent methyltransferase